MLQLALLCISLLALQSPTLQLKRIAFVPTGSYAYGCVVDSDHNGMPEYIFQTDWDPTINAYVVNYLECRPVNKYELVKSDTGVYPPPPGRIVSGNFWPADAGDIDRDGLTDLVGDLYYADSAGNEKTAVCTIESPDSSSYPDSVVWWSPLPWSQGSAAPVQYADMDRDGRREIVQGWGWQGTMVFENSGDNRETLVYSGLPVSGSYAISDFDQNGKTDYAGCQWDFVFVSECIGDNQYAQVCSLATGRINCCQLWTGDDIDRNGKPEFFASFVEPVGSRDTLCLYLFEALAEHEYTYYQIDTLVIPVSWAGTSLCADLDGDGVEEVVWSAGTRVMILKATGPHEFERVSTWLNDIGVYAVCNAGDMNGNGYNELLVGGPLAGGGGAMRTAFLEVEAVRILSPDTVSELRPGDSCVIRWRIYAPPRCDSVSLFLKSDTTIYPGERFWRLDTIATGLAPTESSYSWVVPDTQLAWAKVLAIAYGPGWQYDESDSAFSILPPGVAEQKQVLIRNWSLTVAPNPASDRATVSYDVPCKAAIRLALYDAAGQMVGQLASGDIEPGRYAAEVRTSAALPPGVYFCTLDNGEKRTSRKVVLTE